MKLSVLVTLIPLLLSSSTVFAAVNRDVLRARQAHVKKDLVDVCAALDVDVQLALGGHNIVFGHLNLCLCLSLLPGFLDSNSVARSVVSQVGSGSAHNYFTQLIQNQQNKRQCHYPPHANPLCSIQHPCDFQCGDGYTPSPSANPTQCVCKAPYTECNGVCGYYPRGCGSQSVSKSKRGQPTCDAGKTMCGVPGSKTGIDCVDANSDVESCGGCTTPSPFGNNVADGTNCKGIPNVDRVSCNGGTCEVLACKDGYNVSPTRNSCVNPRLNRVRRARDVDVVGRVFDLLTSHNLLAPWLDVVTGQANVIAGVAILNYDNVLQFLLAQDAIVGVGDLLTLKDILGLGIGVLRRDDSTTVEGVLGLLLQKNLIIPEYDDLARLEGFLGARLDAFDINDLLQFLLAEGLILGVPDILTLRDLLGLGVGVL